MKLGLFLTISCLAARSAFAQAPEPPQQVRAEVSASTVTLSWIAPGTGPVPTGYVVEAAGSPSGAALTSLATGGSPLVVPGVPDGIYYVRVYSTSGAVRSVASVEVMAAVGQASDGCRSAPHPPENVIGRVSGSSVTLNWSASAAGCRPSSFVLQAGSAPGASDVAVANMGALTTLTASAPAGRYYVRVVGVNAWGASSPSPELTVTVEASGALYGGRLAASLTGQHGVSAIVADVEGHVGATMPLPGTSTLGAAVLQTADGRGLTVFTDPAARPSSVVTGDTIVVFGNYTPTTVDIALVVPGRPSVVRRGVPLPATALRAALGTDALAAAMPIDAPTLKREISNWALAINAATCVITAAAVPEMPPAALAVSALGCGITAHDVYRKLTGGTAEDPELVASREATNHIAGGIQCADGVVRRDPGRFFDCTSAAAGAIGTISAGYLDSRRAEVDEAVRLVGQPSVPASGVSGTWSGTAYAGAFSSTGPITLTLLEGSRGSLTGFWGVVQLVGYRIGNGLWLDRVDGGNCEQWQLTFDGRTLNGFRWYSCGPLAFRFPINRIELTHRVP